MKVKFSDFENNQLIEIYTGLYCSFVEGQRRDKNVHKKLVKIIREEFLKRKIDFMYDFLKEL